jgi:hypothetical protein
MVAVAGTAAAVGTDNSRDLRTTRGQSYGRAFFLACGGKNFEPLKSPQKWLFVSLKRLYFPNLPKGGPGQDFPERFAH